jgi:hypothetical protein
MIFRYRIVVSNRNHRAVFFDDSLFHHITAKGAAVRIGGLRIGNCRMNSFSTHVAFPVFNLI